MKFRNVTEHINSKQDKIDGSNKLDYSLLANTPDIPSIEGLASEEDLGNNLFTPIDSSIIVDIQHAYKIGKLLFIHVIFHKSSAPSETGTYKIGSFSERPLHTHAFPVAGFNENTNNAVSETGAVMTNGDVYVHFTQKTATSNVKFDLLCIYCEGVLLGIGQGTNIFNLGDTPVEDPEEGSGE